MIIIYNTANIPTKNLEIWSLSQTNSWIKEVGFLSTPSNFLAQWFRNFDSKILGPTILSVRIDRIAGVHEDVQGLLRDVTLKHT